MPRSNLSNTALKNWIKSLEKDLEETWIKKKKVKEVLTKYAKLLDETEGSDCCYYKAIKELGLENERKE